MSVSTDFIESLQSTLSDAVPNTVLHPSGNTLKVKLLPEDIEQEGVVSITATARNGKTTVRINYLNDTMNRLSTVILRDTTVGAVVPEAVKFINSVQEHIVNSLKHILEFRNTLNKCISGAFTRTCDSKCMSVFTSPKIALQVSYDDMGNFVANFKRTRRKANATEVFQYAGIACKPEAEKLSRILLEKYEQS